ncbi:MAG: HAMP domain-containing histidine kinase [Nitrospirae bacterium]|nr:HAMP domain-containing histidine kinase [Nitrospirota bacterium]
MVSGVAHQLNNPLSNISTSCQILLEEIEGSDMSYKRDLMQQIEEQIDRAKNMVHSLLEFSRKKEFKNEPLPLIDLVEDSIRLLQGVIPSRLEVKVDISENLWIIADKQRIQQAILNIIKNSIDAVPDEGQIFISARSNIGTKSIDLAIKDTGIGIEPEDINKIFNPFFTTKTDGKGSGLGLFVAREIIKEHDGIIEVNSKPGEGTVFTVKLPLKEINGK